MPLRRRLNKIAAERLSTQGNLLSAAALALLGADAEMQTVLLQLITYEDIGRVSWKQILAALDEGKLHGLQALADQAKKAAAQEEQDTDGTPRRRSSGRQ